MSDQTCIQKRREKAAKKGLCGSCMKRRPPPDMKTCSVCSGRVQTAKKIRREGSDVLEDGWHVCCSQLFTHRFDCTEAPREQRELGPYLPLMETP